MTLIVHQFACLDDNYGFLVHDSVSGQTACIDTPDASVILAELAGRGWTLAAILNTHWHGDHTGGNALLHEATGAQIIGPTEVAKRGPMNRIVREGDVVEIGSLSFEVISTAGHTLGHVCYFEPNHLVAFVGDTLFALGCGRLFEGTAEQMWQSLRKLAALPKSTKVYCAHEYTQANAEFALSVDANPLLRARSAEIAAARRCGAATVPTTIEAELATNPFLRAPDVDAFAKLRRAKDDFRS